MNGRVYDPAIGRFLSVDPVFQFPENTQSLNPYTYVLNSPLSATDPTGFMLSVDPSQWDNFAGGIGGMMSSQKNPGGMFVAYGNPGWKPAPGNGKPYSKNASGAMGVAGGISVAPDNGNSVSINGQSFDMSSSNPDTLGAPSNRSDQSTSGIARIDSGAPDHVPVWPTEFNKVTADFGEERDTNGDGAIDGSDEPHSGADLRARHNSMIRAPLNGVVLEVRTVNHRGEIVIQYDNDAGVGGFAHVVQYNGLQVGDRVSAGQDIAVSDGSGTPAPHLHYTYRRTRYSEPIDPMARSSGHLYYAIRPLMVDR